MGTTTTLHYAEMMAALNAIGRCGVYMRARDDWYVHQAGVEIGGNGLLSSVSVSGATPINAIEKYWAKLTNLDPGLHVVIGAMREDRRAVRWNGFMWDDVKEPQPPRAQTVKETRR